MATCYTAKLCDGEQSFEDFMLGLACAFFYDTSKLPEKWEANRYYKDRLLEEQAELARIGKMTKDEAEREAGKEFVKAMKEYENAKRKRAAIKDRLLAMRSKVSDWEIPTQKHVELKKFALQQIDDTIEHDTGPLSQYATPKRMTGDEWLQDKLALLKTNIAFTLRRYDEETERARIQNEWCDALRDSLKQQVSE